MTATVGVLLMAYGSPGAPEQIEGYYTDIRRGRPPSPEQLADLTARYAAIGGVSPLAARTEAQRVALQAALNARHPDHYVVGVGLKHAEPRIEAGVDALAGRGVTQIVGVVLAPHYSAFSVGQYVERMTQAARQRGLAVSAITSWATEPALIEFLAAEISGRRRGALAAARVVFTAHSLPARIVDTGDPYPNELRATAQAVAHRLGITEGPDWEFAWQSAGRTSEPWLGPDIGETIDRIAAGGEASGVIVCACGFVADHLEVLYDLDIEARRRAADRGLSFDRTACVNDDAAVFAALAGRVVELVESVG